MSVRIGLISALSCALAWMASCASPSHEPSVASRAPSAKADSFDIPCACYGLCTVAQVEVSAEALCPFGNAPEGEALDTLMWELDVQCAHMEEDDSIDRWTGVGCFPIEP